MGQRLQRGLILLHGLGVLGAAVLAAVSFSWSGSLVAWLGFGGFRGPELSSHGLVSPISAVGFGLASLSFLLSLPLLASYQRQWLHAAWLSGALLLAQAYLLVLGYALGSPLFYGGGVAPPALPTAVSFFCLGIGLLVVAVPLALRTLPRSEWEWRNPYGFIVIYGVLCLGVLSLGFQSTQYYIKNFRREVGRELALVTELKVKALQAWRQERLADAKLLRENKAFQKLVLRFVTRPQDQEAQDLITNWLGGYVENFEYCQVRLYDSNGMARFAFPNRAQLPVPGLQQKVLQAIRSGRVAFVDFYRHIDESQAHLLTLVPIPHPQIPGREMGMVTLRMEPEKTLHPRSLKWPTPRKTAETVLVRREGDSVVYLNALRSRQDSALSLAVPIAQSDAVVVQAALGQSGILHGVDYGGHRVLANAQPVPDSPWYLVSHIEVSEVAESLRANLIMRMTLIVTVLVGVGLGLAWLWRRQSLLFSEERIRATEAKQAVEQKLKTAQTIAKMGSWEYEAASGVLWWSDEVYRIFGMRQGDKAPSVDTFLGYVHPEDREIIRAQIASGKAYRSDYRICLPGGQEKVLHEEVDVERSEDGQVRRLRGTVQDVTEGRKAAMLLEESEWRHRIVSELTTDYIFIVDVEPSGLLKLRWVSENMLRLTGRTREEADTSNVWTGIIHRDDVAGFSTFVRRTVTKAESGSYECRAYYKMGGERWIRIFAKPLQGVEGRVTTVVGAVQDISERKKNERFLEDTQKVAGLGTYLLDVVSGGWQSSEVLDEIFGINKDYVRDVQAWASLIYSDDRPGMVAYFQNEVVGKRQPFDREYRIVRPSDDSLRWVHGLGRLECDAGGQPIRMIGTIQDITQKKIAEEEMAKALREKEVLLKEIHHRVKNNLQVVSSLLSLQAGGVKDEATRLMLEDGRNRINSMALVHERLYGTTDLSKIKFRDYLEGLVAGVRETYRAPHVELTLLVDEDVTMDVTLGIPCGLIINELVSNSFKYAFPNGRKGKIEVALAHEASGMWRLSVADDGVGLPLAVDFPNGKTLGLQLVSVLSQQLGGEISLTLERGTRFTLVFPAAPQ